MTGQELLRVLEALITCHDGDIDLKAARALVDAAYERPPQPRRRTYVPSENRISWAQRRRLRLEMAAALARRAACPYCGRRLLDPNVSAETGIDVDGQAEWDHVVPLCQGGTSERSNLVLCCRGCNTRKSGRTPEQAGMATPLSGGTS